jgi:hypothetical protein
MKALFRALRLSILSGWLAGCATWHGPGESGGCEDDGSGSGGGGGSFVTGDSGTSGSTGDSGTASTGSGESTGTVDSGTSGTAVTGFGGF